MSAAETYILFELGEATYGVQSKEVLHIDMLEHITPVPNAAASVDGVVFSRGQVIPALNLRVRFGLPRVAHAPRTRLLFLKNEQRTVALVVDSAREFRSIPAESIRRIEEALTGIDGHHVRGVATVGDRLVLLLDVGAVLRVDPDSAPAALPALQPSA